MSQILSFGGGGIIPQSVVEDLRGNDGVLVPPFNNTINILGASPLFITGSPITNTLTVADTSRVEATVTTGGANPATLYFFPLINNFAISFDAQIIAYNSTDFSGGAVATLVAAARRGAGGAALIGLPAISISQDFGGPIAINALVVGNSLDIQVIGIAATNIVWKAIIQIVASV